MNKSLENLNPGISGLGLTQHRNSGIGLWTGIAPDLNPMKIFLKKKAAAFNSSLLDDLHTHKKTVFLCRGFQ